MSGKRGVLIGIAVIALSLLFTAGGMLSGKAAATTGINQEMSFEGKVVDNNGLNITDGNYNVEFDIYTGCSNEPTSSTGCTSVWTEDWLVGSSPVTFTSGTFAANLGSITSLPTNIWNSYPLYLSIDVGNTSTPGGSCVGVTNFNTNCDGGTNNLMNPYILLTSSPYALNAGQLGGLAATAFSQLASNQTYTGTNTFQPTTNVTSVKILQNSSGSFGQDVFDVQGSSGGTNNFIQVTSTAANQGAVTIQSLGSNNLNLNSGSNTVSLGATSLTGTGALTVSAASGQSLDLESGTTANLNLGTSANNKTINIGAVGTTANTTTVNIGNSTGAAQTISIGSTNGTGSTTISGGQGSGSGGIILSPNGTSNTGVVVTPANNSTAAFQVTQADGTKLLGVNSTNKNVQIGTSASLTTTPTILYLQDIPNNTGGNATIVGNWNSSSLWGFGPNSNVNDSVLRIGAANSSAGWVTTQNVNLLVAGTEKVQPTTGNDSTTAFQVQNATGTGSLFNVDTANSVITLNSNNSGETAAWVNDTSGVLPAPRSDYGMATANGYIYIAGGQNATQAMTTIMIGKVNADGSINSWKCQGQNTTAANTDYCGAGATIANTNTLPAAREDDAVQILNGYIYVIAGDDSTYRATVYHAKLNADGSTGAWVATDTSIPSAQEDPGSVVVNGYIYIFGGFSAGASNAVYYAKPSANGAITSWATNATNMPNTDQGQAALTDNGYIYLVGNNPSNVNSRDIWYARPNSDGSISSFSTQTNGLPAADKTQAGAVAANGYLYTYGGTSTASATNGTSSLYYTKLGNNGAPGTWSTSANTLPAARTFLGQQSVTLNGYIYAIGGENTASAAQTSVYRASLSRVQVAGSLDLVGLNGQNQADGSSGGELTAGNTNIVGTLQATGTASFLQSVSVTGTLTVGSGVGIQTATNSTTAFQVLNSAAQNYIQVDTSGANLYLGNPGIASTIQVGNTTGAVAQTIGIGNNATASSTTTLTLGSTVGTSATTINGGQGSGAGSIILSPSGASNTGVVVKPVADSTAAFQIQNSSGQSLLTANTSGSNQNNLITNASIESAVAGNWTSEGTSATAIQTSTQSLYGSNSLQVGSGTGTTGGASQKLTATLVAGTQYNVLFYAKGNSLTSTPTVIKAVYSVDGSTQSVACSNTLNLDYRSWQKYTCTFVPTGSPTANNAIFIEATTASQTFFVDGVLVQQSSLADSNYREGQLVVQAVVASPLVLQDNGNSTNAFSVQNYEGGQIFNVDTTDPDNLVDNPSFEVNTTGWAAVGTAPSIARDTSQSKFGLASMKVVSGSAANGGARYTFGSALATGTYTISFSMLSTTGTDYTSVQVGYNNGTTDTFATCANAALTPTPVSSQTSVWMRYTCSGVALTTPASILITMSTATHTFYVDGVEVQTGSTASAYGLGQVSISAPIITPLHLQNQSDSNLAFLIQNHAGLNLFTGDTANLRLQVGSSTASTNGVLLVLNNYSNGATEPTGVNGAVYYNSAMLALRCYIDGIWSNCGGFTASNNAIAAAFNGNTTTEQVWTPGTNITANTGQTYQLPANFCTAGRTFTIHAEGIYSTTSVAESVTLKVKIGTTVLGATGANTPTVSMTGQHWHTDFNIICVSTTSAIGEGYSFVGTSTLNTTGYWPMQNAAAVTIPSAASNLTMSVTFAGTASVSNTITLEQLIIRSSGP